ncbi:hypothetical protein K438DRAFT_1966653 [Mycena galopus ATCC 62051]|nr:hypothetical protein K438DRAFT_1966653 [Mycena galopus ATCC 62051]
MAQRRGSTKHRAQSAAPADEFDFLASQQSTGSEDQAMQLAVAQHLMATKEKKRKEAEKKFLQLAKNKLTIEISAAQNDVRSTLDATEKAYAKFIIDYATVEDTIRALWMEIKKEEQILIDIAKKQRAATEALHIVTEKAQIVGMSQVKEACHDARRMIGTLAVPF